MRTRRRSSVASRPEPPRNPTQHRNGKQRRDLGRRRSGAHETEHDRARGNGTAVQAQARPEDRAHQRRRPAVESRERSVRQHGRREAPERLRDQARSRSPARRRATEQQARRNHDRDRRHARGEEGRAQVRGRGASEQVLARGLPAEGSRRELRVRDAKRERETPLGKDGRLAEIAIGVRRPEGRRRGEIARLVGGVGLVPGGRSEETGLDDRERDCGEQERGSAPQWGAGLGHASSSSPATLRCPRRGCNRANRRDCNSPYRAIPDDGAGKCQRCPGARAQSANFRAWLSGLGWCTVRKPKS